MFLDNVEGSECFHMTLFLAKHYNFRVYFKFGWLGFWF